MLISLVLRETNEKLLSIQRILSYFFQVPVNQENQQL